MCGIVCNFYKNDVRSIDLIFPMKKVRCCLRNFPKDHGSSGPTSIAFHCVTRLLVQKILNNYCVSAAILGSGNTTVRRTEKCT